MIHNFVAGSSFEGDFPGVIYDTVDSKEGTSTPVKYGRGVVSGSDHWYDLENLDIKFFPYKRMNSLVPVGAVRTVGNFFTVFAVESFIDEIAHEIGADPLDLRLSLLKGRGETPEPRLLMKQERTFCVASDRSLSVVQPDGECFKGRSGTSKLWLTVNERERSSRHFRCCCGGPAQPDFCGLCS